MLQELAQAQAAAASLQKQLQQLQEHGAAEALRADEALRAAQQSTQAAAASGEQGVLICCDFRCDFAWPAAHGCPILPVLSQHAGACMMSTDTPGIRLKQPTVDLCSCSRSQGACGCG